VAQYDGKSMEIHRFLMCKGVEWGFQYHNFYGDWELSSSTPLNNGRPHYVHNTMYGGHAHLFHTIDPHYHVPRWVIGPAPGNENGWAFCESDAPTPHEVQATWISWDGFEWHSCKSFRYVPKEDEMDGLDSDDDFQEEDEFYEDDTNAFSSLSSMLAEDEATEEQSTAGGGGKVNMTLDEFEEMLTNRQQTRDMRIKEEKTEAMPSLAEEDGGGEEEAAVEPEDDGGKKGKKKKPDKKSKAGGLFKKKK
jgi:hypothetical protein